MSDNGAYAAAVWSAARSVAARPCRESGSLRGSLAALISEHYMTVGGLKALKCARAHVPHSSPSPFRPGPARASRSGSLRPVPMPGINII